MSDNAFGGRDMSWSDALHGVEESIIRRKASMRITLGPNTDSPRPFIVTAGSYQTLRVADGFIVTFNLDREQLEDLRDVCTKLLDAEAAHPV